MDQGLKTRGERKKERESIIKRCGKKEKKRRKEEGGKRGGQGFPGL